MQKVHFIAIGEAVMHSLAIAISKKNGFLVSGSDEEIPEPSYSHLKTNKLLPEKLGWFPERICKGLSAIIVGTNVASDNPELLQAKDLGIKTYSVPEYLFLSTRSKTRIVVSGNKGKTTISAIIIYVLKQLKMDVDYMIKNSANRSDYQTRLSYEARIAVFEGDEHPTSTLDQRPAFLHYKPHIAVVTGISLDYIGNLNEFAEKIRLFTDAMEVQGRLIHFDGDENLSNINKRLRRDIVAFSYNTPLHEIRGNMVYLKTKKTEVALQNVGEQHLQDIEAARLACRQVGVSDDQFYSVISGFSDYSDD
jgi:UDP-N-acetylmuramate: L-alanyl-gamma-D-glutamyl-meso-diaminopimelate ligase